MNKADKATYGVLLLILPLISELITLCLNLKPQSASSWVMLIGIILILDSTRIKKRVKR
jgi:hypothetical protein